LDFGASALRSFFQRFLDGEFGCFGHGEPHIQATGVQTGGTPPKPGLRPERVVLLQILRRYPLI
jgi:hypothetical protein